MASNVPSTPTSQLSDKRINENENVLARNENTPAKPSTFCLRYILRIDSIRNQHRGYLGWWKLGKMREEILAQFWRWNIPTVHKALEPSKWSEKWAAWIPPNSMLWWTPWHGTLGLQVNTGVESGWQPLTQKVGRVFDSRLVPLGKAL